MQLYTRASIVLTLLLAVVSVHAASSLTPILVKPVNASILDIGVWGDKLLVTGFCGNSPDTGFYEVISGGATAALQAWSGRESAGYRILVAGGDAYILGSYGGRPLLVDAGRGSAYTLSTSNTGAVIRGSLVDAIHLGNGLVVTGWATLYKQTSGPRKRVQAGILVAIVKDGRVPEAYILGTDAAILSSDVRAARLGEGVLLAISARGGKSEPRPLLVYIRGSRIAWAYLGKQLAESPLYYTRLRITGLYSDGEKAVITMAAERSTGAAESIVILVDSRGVRAARIYAPRSGDVALATSPVIEDGRPVVYVTAGSRARLAFHTWRIILDEDAEPASLFLLKSTTPLKIIIPVKVSNGVLVAATLRGYYITPLNSNEHSAVHQARDTMSHLSKYVRVSAYGFSKIKPLHVWLMRVNQQLKLVEARLGSQPQCGLRISPIQTQGGAATTTRITTRHTSAETTTTSPRTAESRVHATQTAAAQAQHATTTFANPGTRGASGATGLLIPAAIVGVVILAAILAFARRR